MPQYVRPALRWAIYFRDSLCCTYCGVSIHTLLDERSGNFLTLDHILPKSEDGDHDASNLVTCCYSCNTSRGPKIISEFARQLGVPRQTLWARIRWRVGKNIDEFRPMAKLAMGEIEGFPIAKLVLDHDFLVRGQWSTSDFDAAHWEHLRKEETLFCVGCGRPRDFEEEQVPVYESEDDLPFIPF